MSEDFVKGNAEITNDVQQTEQVTASVEPTPIEVQPAQQTEAPVEVQPTQQAPVVEPVQTIEQVEVQPTQQPQVQASVSEQPAYTAPQSIYVNPVNEVSSKPPFATQAYQQPVMYTQPQQMYGQPYYGAYQAPMMQPIAPTAPAQVQQPIVGSQPTANAAAQHATQTQHNTEKVNNAFDYGVQKSEKKSEKRPLGRAAVAVLVLLGFIISGGLGFCGGMLANKYGSGTSNRTGTQTSNISGDLNIQKVEDNAETNTTSTPTNNLSVSEITDLVANSVVEITTESVVTGGFSQQYIAEGAGSGVIISSDGYIITNNHVISGAKTIKVTLRNGTAYDATIVGADSVVDIALLKIDAKDLTAAVFGDSDKLKVGDMTVVIGNPLGQLGGTVTDGIISALNRDIVIDDQTMNLLQTNAAINPGNSGGGLFDGRGNLVGIIVAKSSGTDVEGLGFAIPINDVLDILEDLKKYGYVTGRIDLGMTLLDVTSSQMAWMYGVSETGVYVYSVTNNSKAAAAGFVPGDYITEFDGKKVTSSDDINKILEDHKVGDKVEVNIVRRRQTYSLTLELEEYSPNLIGKSENTDGWNNNSNSNNGGYNDYSDDFFDDFFDRFF
ncbi:MAG: trypsin-like peptidase domain-containing protein [Acutalibacteraceae bacterium]